MNVQSISGTENVGTASRTKKTSSSGNSFKSYLGESEELDAIFQKASKKYGVDVKLLKSIAKAESDFDPKATSHCGAMGIMQLMPSTAKGLGVKNAYDAEECIMGGAKLISGLLKQYDGDVNLALAGYNAGTGNVRKYGGVPPFKETQNYIKKINKFMNSGSESGAKVVNYDYSDSSNPTKTSASHTNGLVKGQTVIPSGLQLRREEEERAAETSSSTSSTAASVLEKVGLSGTNEMANILRELEASGQVQDSNDVFAYEDYLKFVDLFYVNQKDENDQDNSKKTDAEVAQLQMSASVSNMLMNL